MLTARLFLASALALTTFACGGEPKPAAAPESTSGMTEAATKEDMPPPPSKETDATKPPAQTGEGAAGGVITVAALKVVAAKKGKNDKAIELKADGSIVIDGKTVAKISGDQVDDASGVTMLTVGVDGGLVGSGIKPGLKFAGDELTMENGDKLAVGDDGSINATKDGKTEAVAKVEGDTKAKRAALILAVLWMSSPESTSKGAVKASTPAKKK